MWRGKAVWLIVVAMVFGAAFIISPAVSPAWAGRSILLADQDGGDGGDMNVDLTVRQVTIDPVRAHVGDTVRIEVWVENRDEGRATTPVEVYANGKEIGSKLLSWDSIGDRSYKLVYSWNTNGLAPGEYKIRASAFVYEDSSPFDNELDVSQPVVLAAPGAPFPDGLKAGGSYTESDPRYRKLAEG